MIVCFRQDLRIADAEYRAGEEADVSSSLAATLVGRGVAYFVEGKRLRQPQQNRIRRPQKNRRA